MIKKRLLPSILTIAFLAGCASTAPAPAPKPAPMSAAMADADAAVKAGRTDQAYTILKAAAVIHPTDKSPWLRMAQLRFEDKNYGEAIVSGLEAIERDPDDMLAYSLVAASGLRVSSKALNDLTQKNGFSGSVRSEAQELAALLHTKLGGPVVPTKRDDKPRTATVRQPAAVPAIKCSGPFCGLN
ncbi:MAG: tetratricopeptide repeat protein [Pseudomonadota bacterium]